jgi:perosamine synthetase
MMVCEKLVSGINNRGGTMSIEIFVAEPFVTEDDARAVYDCVKSGWISMGPQVAAFEEEFAKYIGAKYAVAMNNGTSTLHAILGALGISSGDEVIVPTLTYISSANMILLQGATPVFCECDPKTFNAEPYHAEPLITEKTKAIMTVDMNGLPVDYDKWLELGQKYNIPIIADSAEATGAKYKGSLVGSQAPVHSFSFFPNKSLTTGEGGMVTTNSESMYQKLRIIRNQGQDYRYHHIALGHNYRMTEIQASLGRIQLSRIEWAMERKTYIANFYTTHLQGIDEISIPIVPDYVDRPSWYMYAISLREGIDRDKLAEYLDTQGIETRFSFPPVHSQPYYVERFGLKPEDYPVSMDTWRQLLDLPVGLSLTDTQLARVVETLKSYFKQSTKQK